jgi:hypothetical protein
LFDEAELRKVAVSGELTSALTTIKQFCATNRLVPRFLARPEIFTHGESLAWLRTRLGGIKDHLCLSDGHTVRPIPSMRNHLFLYRLASHESTQALNRLHHRAPDLLGSLTSQINTAMVFGQNAGASSPPSILLQMSAHPGQGPNPGIWRRPSFGRLPQMPHPHPKAGTSPHYYSFAAAAASATQTLASPISPLNSLRGLQQLTYVPMTSSACHDPAFTQVLADRVSACLTDASNGYVIQLPDPLRAGGADHTDLKALIQTLQIATPRGSKSPRTKPRATTQHHPVILLTDADWISQPLEGLPCPVALVLHSSYAFWKHPREHYDPFRDITVCDAPPESHEPTLRKLLSAAFGRKPKLEAPRLPHEAKPTKSHENTRRGLRTTASSSAVSLG